MRKFGVALAFAAALSLVTAPATSTPARADGGAIAVAVIGALVASQWFLCDPDPKAKRSIFCIWAGGKAEAAPAPGLKLVQEAGPFFALKAVMDRSKPNITVKTKKKK